MALKPVDLFNSVQTGIEPDSLERLEWIACPGGAQISQIQVVVGRIPSSMSEARLETGDTTAYKDSFYRGVWLVQQLQEAVSGIFYPTLEDLYAVYLNRDIILGRRSTRNLVLFPNEHGQLTERATNIRGKRLTGHASPVMTTDYLVYWNTEKDELDHIEIKTDSLVPLEGLVELLPLTKPVHPPIFTSAS
ncbi:hypothetical protein HYV82_00800 [Candidatus Woesearchaeota archaeon]|nr:hypothetical protein [Candidatus Woesearchaeota archaeon]